MIDTLSKKMKTARFSDMQPAEQEMALGILAKNGFEAMARYISRVHTDNTHFLYAREERSPLEGTKVGTVMWNIALFPRAAVEKAVIKIPKSVILGTGVFDQFIEDNNLIDIHVDLTDKEIKKQFLNGVLPEKVNTQLFQFLYYCSCPIAVRSSGLLEDSQSQPFAGIYATYMLSNNYGSINERIKSYRCYRNFFTQR